MKSPYLARRPTCEPVASVDVADAVARFTTKLSSGLRDPEDSEKLRVFLETIKAGNVNGLEPIVMAPSADKGYRTVSSSVPG